MNKEASGGVSLFGLLGVALIVLKLCGAINWSWLWVLAPLWIPAVIAILVIGICYLIAGPRR